jgi:hypothetical protein
LIVGTAAVFDVRSLAGPLVPMARDASNRATAAVTSRLGSVVPAATDSDPAVDPDTDTDAASEIVQPGATRLSGMLAVRSRVPLELFVGARRIGSTDDGQIMLEPGDYTVRLVSERFGYSGEAAVRIKSASVTQYDVTLPQGLVRVNTVDGATVFVDGARIGVAPLAPISVTIGTRQISVTLPGFEERREGVEVRQDGTSEVTITLEAPAAQGDPSSLPPLSRQ